MLAAWQKLFDAGQVVMVGAMLSNTVMVCVADVEFPATSVTVYVRRILKRLRQVDSVITSACVTVSVELQLSEAVTAPSFATGTADAQLTVTSPGILRFVGAVTSWTVIVCTQVENLPASSVAFQVLVIV